MAGYRMSQKPYKIFRNFVEFSSGQQVAIVSLISALMDPKVRTLKLITHMVRCFEVGLFIIKKYKNKMWIETTQNEDLNILLQKQIRPNKKIDSMIKQIYKRIKKRETD